MAEGKKPTRQAVDPHGYQPILIDEDCLTPEDRREDIMEFFASIGHVDQQSRGPDLQSIMTPAELEIYERPQVMDSPYYLCGYSPEQEDEKCGIAWRARVRAYSREKYANGQAVWYGDGVPYGRSR